MKTIVILTFAAFCALLFSSYASAEQAGKEKLNQERLKAIEEYNADFTKAKDRETYTKWGDKFSGCAGVYYVLFRTMKSHHPDASAKFRYFSTGARKVAAWHYAKADHRAHPFKYYLKVVDPIQRKKMVEMLNYVKAKQYDLYEKSANQCVRLDVVQKTVLEKFNQDSKH